MEYSQLSDFEINKRVAEIVYSIEVVADDFYAKDVPFAYHRDEQVFIFIDEPLSGEWRSYNPCNNPADAWPIISSSRISIEYDAEERCDTPAEWVTAYGIDELKVHVVSHQPCDKALRSAMIVFLMMQDAKNA